MIGVLTMNKERDNILIESTLKGNINSFEELMTLYQGKLFNFLLKMTSSREDAEEITQEVFIRYITTCISTTTGGVSPLGFTV